MIPTTRPLDSPAASATERWLTPASTALVTSWSRWRIISRQASSASWAAWAAAVILGSRSGTTSPLTFTFTPVTLSTKLVFWPGGHLRNHPTCAP